MTAMQRRFWLAAAGVSALGAGAWWRSSTESEVAAQPEGLQSLWQHHFAGPDGSLLEMQSLRGRPLLINFWATWCAPCVAEMPELDRLAREWRGNTPTEALRQVQPSEGVQDAFARPAVSLTGANVLGIAIDQEEAVRRFLANTKVSFPVVLGGSEGLALARALGNDTGGLPFSLLISADGHLLGRKLGASSREDLQSWSRLAQRH